MLSREKILGFLEDGFDLCSLKVGQTADRHVCLRHLHLTASDVEASRDKDIYLVLLKVSTLIDEVEEEFGVGCDALRERKAVAEGLDLVASR